jgi:DNA polymerase-3 subunit epsilon
LLPSATNSSISATRSYVERNTLDDLRSRYGVDRSRRTQHGALLDAELLAAVYVELTTTRQAALQLEPIASVPSNIQGSHPSAAKAVAAAGEQGRPSRASGVQQHEKGAGILAGPFSCDSVGDALVV